MVKLPVSASVYADGDGADGCDCGEERSLVALLDSLISAAG